MPITFTACLGSFAELLQTKAAGVSDFLAGKLCASGLSDEALEQVLALTLGIRDSRSATMALFREAGVSHVMALSGLHLTVFCLFLALFVYPVRRVMGPFWLRLAMMLLVVALVWGYVLVAGCPMSMVRAAAMFSVAIAGALFYWRMTLLQVWTLAVMLILTLSPRSLTDVGFQLSSMATLGIATFGALKSRWEVQRYLDQIKSGESSLLMKVTSGYHYHTVSADSKETLDLIQEKLAERGFLAPLRDYEPVNFWVK